MAPPRYTYHYLNVRGIGEPGRQLFVLAGVPFVDRRYEFDEFAKHRHETPFGQLPVLEFDDGRKFAQSQAIFRYLGREFGFAGKTPYEQAWVDSLGDQYTDYWTEILWFFRASVGRFNGDVEKLKKEAGEPGRDKFFGIIEKQLATTGTGFLVGDGLTWIDLAIADHVDIITGKHPGFFDKFPLVVAHEKRIHDIPALKKWIAERPKTPF